MTSTPSLHLSDRFSEHAHGLWWRSAPSGVSPVGQLPQTPHDVVEWAQAQPGQFAGVVLSDDATYLVTDFCRSIPLFYAWVEDKWIISDDINLLVKALPSPTRDLEAAEVFRHCGVVLGSRTLVEGVYQVPAASIVTLSSSSTAASSQLYRRFSYTHDYEGQDELFEDKVLKVLHAQFRSLVETAGNRLLAIPLSGGIDSRLLAVLLKEIPHANLLAFTYGQKGSHEAQLSERVARELGIPWVFVESDPVAVREAWVAHGHAFLAEAWAGASLPHYQDWYALHVLTKDGTLPPGTIILPGHTVVGNLHDAHVLTNPKPMDRGSLARLLLHHHGGIQGTPEGLARLPYVHHVMDEYFDEMHFDGSAEQRQDIIECFNLRERQAKYINNSMRAYEHFQLDWAMPMLNAPFVELWQQGSRLASAEDRLWYEQVTNRLYEATTGQVIDYFTTTVNKLPPMWKQVGVQVAESSGVATFLRRAFSAKTQINHPMAFHALLNDDDASRIIIRRTLRGSSIQGEFVDRFLNEAWLPGPPLLPPLPGGKKQ